MLLKEKPIGSIRKVTVEKIYLGRDKENYGSICKRVYHVIYSTGVKRTYNIPPDTVTKFIKENCHEMSKVAYNFTDRSV